MCARQRVARRKKILSEFSITQQQGLVDFLVFVFANYANFSPELLFEVCSSISFFYVYFKNFFYLNSDFFNKSSFLYGTEN